MFRLTIFICLLQTFPLLAKTPPLHPGLDKGLKQQQKFYLLLMKAEAWDHNSRSFVKNVWTNDLFQKMTNPTQRISIEIPDKFDSTEYTLPIRLLKLPCLVMLDSKGRPIALWNTINNKSTVTSTQKFLKNGLQILNKRDRYWSSSSLSAVQIGQGLDTIPRLLSDPYWRKAYESTLNELKVKDSQDKSGYVLKYINFEKSIYGTIDKAEKAKSWPEIQQNLKFLDKNLNFKCLAKEQFQKIHICKFTNLKIALEKKLISRELFSSLALNEVKSIQSINADSLHGKMVDYLKKEISRLSKGKRK